MRIKLLTSSRADYGIYSPLLKKLCGDSFFELEIVAFGTHLSKKHGYTIKSIQDDGFKVKHTLKTLPKGDSPAAISLSMAKTLGVFGKFWEQHASKTDLIICLGDRYEMMAAVLAAVPFGIEIAHLHGGETTQGAIDNVFRHSLSHMASLHFTSTKLHAKRVELLIESKKNIFNVGALGIDAIKSIELFDKQTFSKRFGLPLESVVLVTYHPETVAYKSSEKQIRSFIHALKEIRHNIIITMPNADTGNEIIRKHILEFANTHKNVFAVESLGSKGYFTAMKHCKYVLGNSSSGIIEAASFGKYVINVGDRQKGRSAGKNIFNCANSSQAIMKTIAKVESLKTYKGKNIYGNGTAANKIISALKKHS